MIRRTCVLIFILLFSCSLDSFARDEKLFPRPAAIEHDVQFWKRVYTEVTTNEGFIHDDRNLAVVYEKIRLPQDVSRKQRSNYVKRIKKKYEGILRNLASGKRSNLSYDEERVLSMWPKDVSNRELRQATDRIRFQLGQANKFRAGLERSGTWKPYILDNLDKMGLPSEIASLPHVESSFNDKAYSKVGAAGLWQFMRSTGRRFMRVDHVVDERMDPFIASVAAARLLENNYAVTGAWPLAMTAYNHGAAGMRRAAQKLGTTDIVTILRKYKSRTFGFASRNFYVAFLAAVEIDSDPHKYFPNLQMHPPVDYEFVKLPGYVSANDLVKVTGLSRAELMAANPALRPAVWNGNKFIPKGYELRINRRTVSNASEIATKVASMSSNLMFAKQKPDRYHRVRRGQTLSTIAARYRVRLSDLVAVNNLRSRHRIRVGQVLRLPQPGKRHIGKTIQVAEERSPTVDPQAIPASGTYKVRRGDNINSIARRYGMTVSELARLNGLRNKNRIYPGQRLMLAAATPSEDGDFHVVRRGDSIDKISRKYGKKVNEILALNNLKKKNKIYPGQKLLIAKAEIPEEKPAAVVESKAAEKSETTPETVPETVPASEPVQVALNTETAEETPATEDTSTTTVADESAETPQVDGKQSGKEVEANNEPADDEQQMLSVLGVAVESGGFAGDPEESNIDGTNQDTGQESEAEQKQAEEKQIANAVSIPSKEEETVEDSADSLAEKVMSEAETELLADPTNYSVSKNNTIEVQAAETLGHYAEWLQIRASQLRRINRMRYGKPVVIGKRIKLSFGKVTREEFEDQRVAYHKAIQEEFFERYQITGSDKHKIRRGQSVWKLAKKTYKIPIWLLRQYNPDLNFNKVKPGMVITFPKINERNDDNLKASEPGTPAEKVAARKAD
ncbi:LysM peptidoglycan-binding domain-containing protein [Kaarinaea lacus]